MSQPKNSGTIPETKEGYVKKLGLILLAIIVVFGIGLWLVGKETRVVTTEINISAPPSKVWGILTNIEDWENWSPIIKKSSGTTALHSKLTITMISEEGKSGQPGPKYEPVITVFDAPKKLAWIASMGPKFVMTNGKVLELEPTDSGTRLIHKETFSGMMVPLVWGSVQKNVPGMLDSMNQALKELVEESSDIGDL